jgi:hypothetical protein
MPTQHSPLGPKARDSDRCPEKESARREPGRQMLVRLEGLGLVPPGDQTNEPAPPPLNPRWLRRTGYADCGTEVLARRNRNSRAQTSAARANLF